MQLSTCTFMHAHTHSTHVFQDVEQIFKYLDIFRN